MIISSVFGQIVSLFIIIFIGYVISKKKLIGEKGTKGLSIVITQVSLPAMALVSLQYPFSVAKLKEFGLTYLGTSLAILIGFGICWVVCIVLKTPAQERGVWLTSAAFYNAIFMGKPIMTALYGEDVIFPVAALMTGFNVLCFSLGLYLMSKGKEEGPKRIGGIVLHVIKNPTLIATAFSFTLFVFSIKLPQPVYGALYMLSNLATPLALLITGISLSKIHFREWFNDYRVYIITVIRLLVTPVCCWFVFRLFITDPVILGVLMIAASMPVATTVTVFSEQYGNHPVLASKTVFITTLLSVITAPVLLNFLLS